MGVKQNTTEATMAYIVKGRCYNPAIIRNNGRLMSTSVWSDKKSDQIKYYKNRAAAEKMAAKLGPNFEVAEINQAL
jgi:hypothetical protein